MTTTHVPYPVITALVKAEEMPGVGPNRQWIPDNEDQREFLEDVFRLGRDDVGEIPEIESIASWHAAVINDFLRSKGFTIVLRPLAPDTFGVASVLDLAVEWVHPGIVDTVEYLRATYPAVRMPVDDGSVSVLTSKRHPNPIVVIETTSGEIVYMTAAPDAPRNLSSVLLLTKSLVGGQGYNSVVFPMVDLCSNTDLSWIIGMETICEDGRRARISQAVQQSKLRMNEIGARAESAAAIAVTKEASFQTNDLIINEPFLFWIVRGLSFPIFAAHITPEDWKNPGSIK